MSYIAHIPRIVFGLVWFSLISLACVTKQIIAWHAIVWYTDYVSINWNIISGWARTRTRTSARRSERETDRVGTNKKWNQIFGGSAIFVLCVCSRSVSTIYLPEILQTVTKMEKRIAAEKVLSPALPLRPLAEAYNEYFLNTMDLEMWYKSHSCESRYNEFNSNKNYSHCSECLAAMCALVVQIFLRN